MSMRRHHRSNRRDEDLRAGGEECDPTRCDAYPYLNDAFKGPVTVKQAVNKVNKQNACFVVDVGNGPTLYQVKTTKARSNNNKAQERRIDKCAPAASGDDDAPGGVGVLGNRIGDYIDGRQDDIRRIRKGAASLGKGLRDASQYVDDHQDDIRKGAASLGKGLRDVVGAGVQVGVDVTGRVRERRAAAMRLEDPTDPRWADPHWTAERMRRYLKDVHAMPVFKSYSKCASPVPLEWQLGAADIMQRLNELLVVASAGAGKSFLYLEAVRRWYDAGKSCVIVVPNASDISNQFAEMAKSPSWSDKKDHIQSIASRGSESELRGRKRIHFMTYISAGNRILNTTLLDGKCIVMDEIHSLAAREDFQRPKSIDAVNAWLSARKYDKLLGLTATPLVSLGRLGHFLRLVQIFHRGQEKPLTAAEFLRRFLTQDDGDKEDPEDPKDAATVSMKGGGVVGAISNFFGWDGTSPEPTATSGSGSVDEETKINRDLLLDPMDQAWTREISSYHDCGGTTPPAQMSESQKKAFRQAQAEESQVRAIVTRSHMSDQNQRDLEKWFHGLSVYMYSTDRFQAAVPRVELDKYERAVRPMPFLVDPKYYVGFTKRTKSSLFHHLRMRAIASAMTKQIYPFIKEGERSLIVVPNKGAVRGVYETLVENGVDETRLYVAVVGDMDAFYKQVARSRGLSQSGSYDFAGAIKRFNGGLTTDRDYFQRIMVVTLDFAHGKTFLNTRNLHLMQTLNLKNQQQALGRIRRMCSFSGIKDHRQWTVRNYVWIPVTPFPAYTKRAPKRNLEAATALAGIFERSEFRRNIRSFQKKNPADFADVQRTLGKALKPTPAAIAKDPLLFKYIEVLLNLKPERLISTCEVACFTMVARERAIYERIVRALWNGANYSSQSLANYRPDFVHQGVSQWMPSAVDAARQAGSTLLRGLGVV